MAPVAGVETPAGWRWVLGLCRGDTPQPGWGSGVAGDVQGWCIASSRPQFPLQPWHAALLGCLPLWFSLSAPIFGLLVSQSPSCPTNPHPEPGQGVVGPNPNPALRVSQVLIPPGRILEVG